MQKKRKGRLITRPDIGSYWISFSDMLSSMLLVFILAVCFSIYQYYSLLDIKTKELNDQKAELDRTQIVLGQKEEDLKAAQLTLTGKEEEVASIQIQLTQQKDELFAAQTALKTKEEEQAKLQLRLASQAEALGSQEIRLGALQSLLNHQQKQIDDLLGVRTDIIRDLSLAFGKAQLNVKVDANTGDIVLDSRLMFETGSDLIAMAGQSQLSKIIPIYLSVLMRTEYKDYVAEIVVEGHTDSKGSYIYNLGLSQSRALSVVNYCLEMPGLSEGQRGLLQKIITAKGRSFSNLIYNEDGTENMDASRRVEIKFRLKDSEMITKMSEILSPQTP